MNKIEINYYPDYKYAELCTGICMSYVELGDTDGKKIVLIHGAIDSYIGFSQVGAYLANCGYHVYIPELRGHGRTDKPEGIYTIEVLTEDIYSWMVQLGIEKAYIVGHSMGSMIAQCLYLSHPDCVYTLSLLSTSASALNNPKTVRLLDGDEELPGLRDMQNMSEEYMRWDLTYTNFDPAFQEAVYDTARQMPVHAWRNMYEGLIRFDNRSRLKEIVCPVQVIWGSEDDFFDRETQDYVLTHLGAEFILFEVKKGCTHDLHCSGDMGKTVAANISQFVEVSASYQS